MKTHWLLLTVLAVAALVLYWLWSTAKSAAQGVSNSVSSVTSNIAQEFQQMGDLWNYYTGQGNAGANGPVDDLMLPAGMAPQTVYPDDSDVNGDGSDEMDDGDY